MPPMERNGEPMRSKSRLIEVLGTVNPDLYPKEAPYFYAAAAALRDDKSLCTQCRNDIISISQYHESPHVRELADEVLNYMRVT